LSADFALGLVIGGCAGILASIGCYVAHSLWSEMMTEIKRKQQ
jgi:preprotein translocase subunit SecF